MMTASLFAITRSLLKLLPCPNCVGPQLVEQGGIVTCLVVLIVVVKVGAGLVVVEAGLVVVSMTGVVQLPFYPEVETTCADVV